MVVTARMRRIHAARWKQRQRRRDSHRSYPDLLQTHNIGEGETLSTTDNFPSLLAPITFASRFRRLGSSNDVFLSSDLFELSNVAGGIRIDVGTFSKTVAFADGRSAQFALAFRPGDAQVRLWIDSVCVAAATYSATAPSAWATVGNVVSYDNAGGVDLETRLDVFYCSRPIHFGLPRDDVVSTFDDLLCRAALATFYTEVFPFVQKPDLGS